MSRAKVLNFADAPFLYHVIQGGLLVDEDEDIRCGFMEGVIRHYLEKTREKLLSSFGAKNIMIQAAGDEHGL